MSKKMLVVDDEEMVRKIIDNQCKKNGWESDSTGTAGEAKAKVGGNSYDAVIIDFNLDGMKGDQLLKELKEKGKVGKAILMSGDAVADFQAKGFDFYLQKPVKADEFKDLVGKL